MKMKIDEVVPMDDNIKMYPLKWSPKRKISEREATFSMMLLMTAEGNFGKDKFSARDVVKTLPAVYENYYINKFCTGLYYPYYLHMYSNDRINKRLDRLVVWGYLNREQKKKRCRIIYSRTDQRYSTAWWTLISGLALDYALETPNTVQDIVTAISTRQ